MKDWRESDASPSTRAVDPICLLLQLSIARAVESAVEWAVQFEIMEVSDLLCDASSVCPIRSRPRKLASSRVERGSRCLINSLEGLLELLLAIEVALGALSIINSNDM